MSDVYLKVGNKIFFPKEMKLDEEKEKIVKLLLMREMSLKEIAKELKISEQLAYYKLKKLIREGLVEKKDRKYRSYNSYYVIIGKENSIVTELKPPKFLKHFINSEIFDGYIVVGNIDPHGEFSARARDVQLSAYISFILGKYAKMYKDELVKFDTEIISQNLLRENLIVIGGPVTNTVAYKLNSFLKVRFLQELNWVIYSEFSKKIYEEEFSAIITLTNNPWNKNKKILWIAGRRNVSTKLALMFLDKIENEDNFYYIINAKDLDGDGKLESIEVLEKS